jgi:hypothetical protein
MGDGGSHHVLYNLDTLRPWDILWRLFLRNFFSVHGISEAG